MFKKSLVLLCMMFGLNALGSASVPEVPGPVGPQPPSKSAAELAAVITGDGKIHDGHNTWELQRNFIKMTYVAHGVSWSEVQVPQAAILTYLATHPFIHGYSDDGHFGHYHLGTGNVLYRLDFRLA